MSVVVITGGGSGIGLEAARIIGKQGYHIIIAGRTAHKLEEAAVLLKREGIDCEPFVCGVSKRENVKELALWAKKMGEVKALINSAGLSPNMADAERLS